MNAKQILTIFVISILMFFSGCNSLKRRIVVGQEKVGIEGEDYMSRPKNGLQLFCQFNLCFSFFKLSIVYKNSFTTSV